MTEHDRRMRVRETSGIEAQPISLGNVWYDYKNQAWVRNGKYQSCAHPDEMQCMCYGRLHDGEIADVSLRERES